MPVVEVTSAYRGPAGPSGGADEYEHSQSVAAVEWIVNHNLGEYPSITVLNTGGQIVDAAVINISVNQARVYFNTPQMGKVLAR